MQKTSHGREFVGAIVNQVGKALGVRKGSLASLIYDKSFLFISSVGEQLLTLWSFGNYFRNQKIDIIFHYQPVNYYVFS